MPTAPVLRKTRKKRESGWKNPVHRSIHWLLKQLSHLKIKPVSILLQNLNFGGSGMNNKFRFGYLAVITFMMCGGSVLALAAEEPFTTPLDVPVLGPKSAQKSLIKPAEESLYSLFSLEYGALAGGEYNSNIYKAARDE